MSCLLQIRISSRYRIPSYHRLSDFTRCLSSAGSSFYLLLFTGSNIYFKARDAAHMEAYFPPFFTSRSWVPLSAILPRSSTRIRSALWIMGIFSSFSGSTKAVASSGITMGHFSELPLPGKCAAAPRRRAVFRRPLPWYGSEAQPLQCLYPPCQRKLRFPVIPVSCKIIHAFRTENPYFIIMPEHTDTDP